MKLDVRVKEYGVKEYRMHLILPTDRYKCPGPCKYLRSYLKEYLDLIIRQDEGVALREFSLSMGDISKNDISKRDSFVTYEIEVKIEYPLDYGMEERVKLIINRFAEFLQRFSDLEVANFIRNEIDKEFWGGDRNGQ